jgi:hypothetical protein
MMTSSTLQRSVVVSQTTGCQAVAAEVADPAGPLTVRSRRHGEPAPVTTVAPMAGVAVIEQDVPFPPPAIEDIVPSADGHIDLPMA